jgi:hypothetical protein
MSAPRKSRERDIEKLLSVCALLALKIRGHNSLRLGPPADEHLSGANKKSERARLLPLASIPYPPPPCGSKRAENHKAHLHYTHTHGAAGCYARVLSFTLMERRYMRRVDGVRFPGAILELIPQAILSARTLPTSCQCTHAGARPPASASIARGTPSTTSLIALMSITTQPSTHKNTPALQLPSINTFIRIQPFPSSAGAMLKNSSPTKHSFNSVVTAGAFMAKIEHFVQQI